ncbi:MAG: hypothetical protein M1587_08395 [Thaumarchaeota archaeon]|nr:hypothetical protein [Nitrososphaerota archaeon]
MFENRVSMGMIKAGICKDLLWRNSIVSSSSSEAEESKVAKATNPTPDLEAIVSS